MIAIVDYRAGNLTSVARALQSLKVPCVVTDRADELLRADRVIFPGVGAAGEAMRNLRASGLDGCIREISQSGKPLLGICLGTQVIFEYSEEDNRTTCLGIIPGGVKRFPEGMKEKGDPLKIPHMGWNRVQFRGNHPLFAGIPGNAEFYFVHSYYPAPSNEVGHCRGDGVRDPVCFRRIAGQSRGGPVPPREKRSFRTADPGKLQSLGWELCSVNGSSPASM